MFSLTISRRLIVCLQSTIIRWFENSFTVRIIAYNILIYGRIYILTSEETKTVKMFVYSDAWTTLIKSIINIAINLQYDFQKYDIENNIDITNKMNERVLKNSRKISHREYVASIRHVSKF